MKRFERDPIPGPGWYDCFFLVKDPTMLVCSKVDDIRLALVLTDYSAPKAKDKMTLRITLLAPKPWCCIKGGNPGGSELVKETNNECLVHLHAHPHARAGLAAEFNYPSVLFVVVVVAAQWIPPANNPFDLFLQV
jgi:hypothetical protein